MSNNTTSLLSALEHKKNTLAWNNNIQITLAILYGAYLLTWAVFVGVTLMHSAPFSLPLAFLCLTPCTVLFYFSLNCIRQQGVLTGTMLSHTTSSRFWNNQVRFLLLFPVSSASFLAIEWAYPFLLSLHFTVVPLAYTIAVSLSLLCLVCLIQTITSACTKGINIPDISTSTRLDFWSQGATRLQHPFSTPYTESFLSELIFKIKKQQGCKTSQPLPLEYALGFMDPKIFTACMHCYDPASPEYKDSCQAVRHILLPFLHRKYDIDSKTLSVLTGIFSTLPTDKKAPSIISSTSNTLPSTTHSQPSFYQHTYTRPAPCHSPHNTPLFTPADTAHVDTSIQPLTQLPNISLPFPTSLLPSLNKTLYHIPLPHNSQISYIEPETQYTQYKNLLSSIHARCCDSNGPSLFQKLYFNEYQSIREAFHAIREKISCEDANAVTWPRRLATPHDRSNTFGRLLFLLMRYHTMFHNPLFASTALNQPGKRRSVRLHKNAPSRKNLYLGITLVARAVKLAHQLETFLQISRDSFTAMGTMPNLSRHIDTLRSSCGRLIENVFHGITQMSVGSTMPRFHLLHGGYRGRMPDIVQNHPYFHHLFSTSYPSQSSTLASIPRHNTLIPTESLIAAYCHARHSSSPAVSQAFSIWHQLPTPRLPFWYHTTNDRSIRGILQSGEIEVRHSLYSGAFISTQIEVYYGKYTFAFSQETPLMANTFNKTSISREYLWHGCKAPIPLSPHLVAIGYPDPDRSSFFGLLSSFGEVREDTSHNIAYFHYREQLVFLFTQDNLATIQKIICSEGGKLAQVRQPQHENPILPLPAHLMLREVYSNYRHTPDYNCYPLKEQLADNRQALSKLLDSPILR